MSVKATPSLLRTLNQGALMQRLREIGPCSRAQLARDTGLSKPTVSQALADLEDRKSTRLNSSHSSISYAVFCLKKKTPPMCSPDSGGTCSSSTAHKLPAFDASSSSKKTATRRSSTLCTGPARPGLGHVVPYPVR